MKATSRRRKNYIQTLNSDDGPTSDQKEKEQIGWNHFNNLLGSYHPRECTLNIASLDFSTCNLEVLDDPISVEEVKKAIFEMHPEKAPGPDGFTGLFYRHCWAAICTDFMAAVRKLETANSQGLYLLNSAYLSLVPKVPDASSPKDFRPISLLHSFSKIIAKVLALRMQPLMKELISPCQNAFIKGRVIHDNFIYVQGLAKALRQKKIPAVLMKLDISKAFDSVSWEFLIQLLRFRGFSEKFISILVGLLATSSTKIQVNSELTDTILHRRGLCQGDPLSPILFVSVMECLGKLMDKAQEDDIFTSFHPVPTKFRSSLYADDAIIFIKPNTFEMQAAVQILNLFGKATGLHTNLVKSSITPICCDNIDLAPIQALAGCNLTAFPCKYLGMPLSDRRLTKNDLQPLLDCFGKKTAGWKVKWLPIASRLILVRVVLSALPTFQLLAIDMPKWIIKEIDRMRRAFLWYASDKTSGGKCLVRWTMVCTPPIYGGLGISNLLYHSRALKVRWLWLQWTHTSKPWAGLPIPSDPVVLSIFRASTTIQINNGDSASFWNCHWLEGIVLRTFLPNLYKQSRRRKITVREALTDNLWIRLCRPVVDVLFLAEFTWLWNMVQSVQL